jgi:predicted nucleotidyltransferase
MQSLKEELRAILKLHPEIRLCVLFGSQACGSSKSGSDVDIAVAGTQVLSPEARLEIIEAFSSTLKREVDVVDLQADAGPILKNALSKGVVIQNADKLLYAKIISRMLFLEADVMPYHHRILSERRERFLNG